jgi:exopolyphosphatase/guanosine-5'-triphosphate,3'-diphosphate pyrophosphatase
MGPLKASVIDIGYNSLKMVSSEIRPDNSFRTYDERGELTRLGEGLNLTGFLNEKAIGRTIRLLEVFNDLNKLGRVDKVLAIATSPVREAGNGREFLEEAESETGLRFRVLTGKEEALFSYLGAARATRLQNVLFFDLGGGSLEMTRAKGFRVKKVLSLPIGVLRLTELYSRKDMRFTKKEYNRMKRHITALLPAREELDLDSGTLLLGVGGTLRALARYDQRSKDYPLNKAHNYSLRRKSIVATHKRLRRLDVGKIASIESIGKDRSETITAGSLIIGMMMNRLGFEDVRVSTHGLRDGILTEFLRDPVSYHRGRFDVPQVEVSLASCEVKRTHTWELVRVLASRGIITKKESAILEEAVEGFIGLYLTTKPENLFYAIISEDSFLDHRDQLALAVALVRAKAPKMANWFRSRYGMVLNEKNKDSIDLMGAVIHFGEILELTHAKAKVRLRDGALFFDIMSPATSFPHMFLDRAARELEEATGRSVKTVIHRVPTKAELPHIVRS